MSKNKKDEANLVPIEKSGTNAVTEKLRQIMIKTKEELKEEGVKEPLDAEVVDIPDTSELTDYNANRTKENADTLALFPFISTSYKMIPAIIINGKPTFKNRLPLPPNVGFKLNTMLKECLDDRHNLQDNLRVILKESLFTHGSTAYLSIPYKTYKGIIDSTKGFKSKLKKLDLSEDVGTEYAAITTELDSLLTSNTNNIISAEKSPLGFSITDSLELFKAGKDIESTIVRKTSSSVATESEEVIDIMNLFSDINDPVIDNSLVLSGEKSFTDDMDGLHMKLNANMLVPLRISDKVIGYIYVMEENGQNISKASEEFVGEGVEYYEEGADTTELQKYLDEAKDRTRSDRKEPKLELSNFDTYKDLFHKHIEGVINKSILGNVIDTPDMQNILAVMFNRAMTAKQTKVIYLPADIVTYYAFDYRENGTGKSILEDINHLVSMLAMLTFAKMRGEIENGIAKRVVKVKIDKDNKKPKEFMTQFINEYSQSQKKSFKWGIKSIKDSASWINNVGLSYQFEHDKVPYNEMSEENQQMGTGQTVSDNFMDDIKSDIIRKFGLTKDMVDSTADVEFATVRILNNELSKNEMSMWQITLMEHFSTHSRQVTTIDAIYNNELKVLVTENKTNIINTLGKQFKERLTETKYTEESIINFLMIYISKNNYASLPTLRNEDDSKLAERFVAYKRSVEDTVDNMILSEESLPAEFAGEEMYGIINAFKRSYKNMLIRKWMQENNYLEEVSDILSVVDGNINIDHLTEYIGTLNALGIALKPYGKLFGHVRKSMDNVVISLKGDVEGGKPTPEVNPTTTEETPAPIEPEVVDEKVVEENKKKVEEETPDDKNSNSGDAKLDNQIEQLIGDK